MKLSELQSTLRELDAQPTKSLGQNFLHDRNIATWTVAQLDIQPDEPWLEIGPGLGSLTEFALQRSPHGTLIEKDDRLIDFLRERYPTLRVIHGDAAQFDVRELLPRGPVKVFGNLPYYVSSQIIFNFTQETCPATGFVFTLQKELAERLAAEPQSKTYGSPTVLIGRRWKVRLVKTLPASVFLPAPKVESAVVSLTPRPHDELPLCDGTRFSQLVKLGFSQRRKQLGNLLSPAMPEWRQAAEALGISPTARAESLSIAQWCALAAWNPGAEKAHTPEGAQDSHGEWFDVVDENDQVTVRATRHQVHLQKLRHRAVHVFVFNRAGELFLQKRSRWKDVHPLDWDSSAAGHVDSGQGYEETAVRELREELGINAGVELIAHIPACAETGEEFVRLFKAHHEGPFCLPPAEVEHGEWFSRAQIDHWIAARPQDFAKGFLKCWEALLATER